MFCLAMNSTCTMYLVTLRLSYLHNHRDGESLLFMLVLYKKLLHCCWR